METGEQIYRVAVIARLEADLEACITESRSRYDAIASRALPPHITVYGTLGVARIQPLSDLAEQINVELKDHPIGITVGEVSRFEGDSPVIWHAVGGDTERLHRINRRFRDTFGIDSSFDYVPHITLTEHLNQNASADVYQALRKEALGFGSSKLSTLEVWHRFDRFNWVKTSA